MAQNDKWEDILSYHLWRQRIPLTENLTTPGYIDLSWDELHLPSSLDGKRFLDVGANDGFYAFEAEKRGADSIRAVDLYDSEKAHYSNKEGCPRTGIDLVCNYLNSKVEVTPLSIYQLKEMDETYDVVLLSNVFAWLQDHFLAMENLAAVTNGMLVIRGGFYTKHTDECIARLEPQAHHNLRPNIRYIREMLRKYGFNKIETHKAEMLPIHQRYNNRIYRVRHGAPIYAKSDSNEVVAHAEMQSGYSIYNTGKRHLIRAVGWVDETQLELIKGETSQVIRILKKILGSDTYYRLKTRYHDRRIDVKEYIIVAMK